MFCNIIITHLRKKRNTAPPIGKTLPLFGEEASRKNRRYADAYRRFLELPDGLEAYGSPEFPFIRTEYGMLEIEHIAELCYFPA